MASTPYGNTFSVTALDAAIISFPVAAASAITNADEVTDYVPGFNFEVVKIDWVTTTPITTAAKTATIQPYIDGTVVPGTATALAGAKAKGVTSNVWAASSHVYGGPTSKLRITASAVTAFVEGAGSWQVTLNRVGNLS